MFGELFLYRNNNFLPNLELTDIDRGQNNKDEEKERQKGKSKRGKQENKMKGQNTSIKTQWCIYKHKKTLFPKIT